MKNNRLVKLLKSLNEEEIVGFGEFITCSYFNKDKDCVRLWEILKATYLGRTKGETTKEELFFRLYPEKKKVNSTIGVKLTTLTRLAERFLTIRQLEAKSVLGQHLLLKSFLEKDVKTHFQSSFTRGRAVNPPGDLGDAEAYYYRYLFEKDYFAFSIAEGKQLHRFNLQDMADAFEIYTISTKMYLWLEILNFQGAFQYEYDFSIFNYMETYLRKSKFIEVPIIKVFYTALCVKREPENTQHFKQLKKYLSEMNDILNNNIKTQLYRIINNHCILKIIQGESEYLNEAFENYKIMLKYNVLTDSKYITIRTFKNCVSMACKLKEFDWTDNFIKKYIKQIDPVFRDSVYHFNQGALYFYQENYEKAVYHLIRMEDVEITYNTNARFLLIKSYYELDKTYYERTEQISRSFMEYMRQNKVHSTRQKQGYINFTKILIGIYRIKHRFGNRSIDVVRKRLDKYEVISDKKWLLEKIGELG